MTQEITKELVCILLRAGIEIWVEKERADKLGSMLKNQNCPQFIEYEEEIINKSDISGIFRAKTMEERSKRKNGQWKCDKNNWHDRSQKCECLTDEQIKNGQQTREMYFNEYGAYPL